MSIIKRQYNSKKRRLPTPKVTMLTGFLKTPYHGFIHQSQYFLCKVSKNSNTQSQWANELFQQARDIEKLGPVSFLLGHQLYNLTAQMIGRKGKS